MIRLLLVLHILAPVLAKSQSLFVPSGATGVAASSNSNIGIGISTPGSRLHIYDNGSGGGEQLRLQRGGGIVRFVQAWDTDKLYLYNRDASKLYMFWNDNGNVGIGSINPDAKLAVKGTIHAEEVRVDLTVPGPDYVFENDYPLISLEDLKTYIDQNKHLPEIPSAKEMEENGINLKEMNLLLLKKVEELTLHQIEVHEEMKEMKKEIQELRNNLRN